jgi:2-oxoglutarate dehydrogenase E1 component
MNIEEFNEKQREILEDFGVNSWFVLELLENFLENPESVSTEWQQLFGEYDFTPYKSNGDKSRKQKDKSDIQQQSTFIQYQPSLPQPRDNEESKPITGVGARIIENMNTSLSIPTATTFRTIPVKILEENRRILNNYLKKTNSGKISFTHVIGWAIVKAIDYVPVMNNAYTVINNESHVIEKKDINLGLAVDVEKKDGSHSLIVPNIKIANSLNFRQYYDAYNDIINRSRKNKIEVADFQGTTITLTNPGGVGTVASNPRLMIGQGAIIAIGALDYPAEYQAVTPDVISKLGISKVMNITSTYDHRIIQGIESGMFLKKINELLFGEEDFYEEIFEDMKIPFKPVKWKAESLQKDEPLLENILELEKQTKAQQLINMYRVRGHLIAHIDPLKNEPRYHPELDPVTYGFTVFDYDRYFVTNGLAGKRVATLREILDILHKTYCDVIGAEYRHIQDPEEKQWLQDKMEYVQNTPSYDVKTRKMILNKLIQAESLEKFIHTKYIGHKRFSLEGSETIIPQLDYMLHIGAEDGAEEFVLGMAHRGRLNVLANIINKHMSIIFSEFEDITDQDSIQGSGDVKYHLGAAGVVKTWGGKEIKVSVASNPSHLEFVNPVVEGIVRAKQIRKRDSERKKIIPVLLHGDAAFAGEGIVAETLNFSQLKGYRTGGTVHIIINNQIGFTTSPEDARSSVYATDIAKMVQAPIFHVNGDDPEAVLWTTQIAFEYRQRYKKDVVIDVLGYRRLGHNEGDEPAFTQPLLYNIIKEHPSTRMIYQNKLLNDKTINAEELKYMEDGVLECMNLSYDKTKSNIKEEIISDLPLAVTDEEIDSILSKKINIDNDVLNEVAEKITYIPDDFSLHPKLSKFIESRKNFLNQDMPIDWAFAEALAFGTLMYEGINIRLSGQDSARGTFSQRHMVLTDIKTNNEYIPHNNIAPDKAMLEPLDSLLSEAAVLGFEYGYSTADPITLVIWEAQFGDFANAAQVIIDNFIVASEVKWNVPNNLVMLLPHGQEGQGPEHSSARIERFLLLCAEENMTVSYPSTPAQYYHLLRSQGKYNRRRPLIIFTPKSLLRHPEARSQKDELINGKYKLAIDDPSVKGKDKIKNVIFCTGKVYYDLAKYKADEKIENSAIVRIERLYPYPGDEVKKILTSYSNAEFITWTQEEPENMGVLNFIKPFLLKALHQGQSLRISSREASPSPAPGSHSIYLRSQKKLIKESFI